MTHSRLVPGRVNTKKGLICTQAGLKCVSVRLVLTLLPQNHTAVVQQEKSSPKHKKAHHNRHGSNNNEEDSNSQVNRRARASKEIPSRMEGELRSRRREMDKLRSSMKEKAMDGMI